MLLAVVFTTAGVAKLLDRPGSRDALRGFGVPGGLVPAGIVLLPLAELGAAIALVPTPTAQWGGVVALLLLLAFAAAIGNAIRQGRAPDCHCFGQLSSAPAGRSTLIRNLILAAPAAYVAIDGPGPSLSAWISDRTAAELVAIAACLAAAALGTLAARLWRENRTLRRDLESARDRLAALPRGLPVGSLAPGFTAQSMRSGTAVTLDSLLARRRPVVLVFVSPGCGPCQELFKDASRWQVALADDITVAFITEGDRADNLVALQNGSGDLLIQDGWEVGEAYKVGNTPTAVAISPDGRIATALVSGDGIEPLVRLTVRQHAMASEPAVPPEPVV
jgi:thiol-disulfide isomerase/thioredoxin